MMKKNPLFLGVCIAILMSSCADDGELVTDFCPNDPNKTVPGVCGCGEDDTLDANNNSVPDCIENAYDRCPDDPNKTEPGMCGCGTPETDTDGDGMPDCVDGCPNDANQTVPNVCGCGKEVVDTDNDGMPDCIDQCPDDPTRTKPTICPCGADESIDENGDGVPDCAREMLCPEGSDKETSGACGCDAPETDTDGDGFPDCIDQCPDDPHKFAEGVCGCGMPDVDTDGDGVIDCLDACPSDPNKIAEGLCGCGKQETLENIFDSDGDGVINCLDACPQNPHKSAVGPSGDGCEFGDLDGDGYDDSVDACPSNPNIHEEGKDCNYVTDNNGNTVFEIWSTYDLKRLSEESAKITTDTIINTHCTTPNKYLCADAGNTNQRYLCSGSNPNRWTQNNCPATNICINDANGENSACGCNPAKTPMQAGDCCDANTFIPICGDKNNKLLCKNGMLVEEACATECETPAKTEDNPQPAAQCSTCVGPALTTGGEPYNCCDPENYVSTCSSKGSILSCNAGIIKEPPCATGCILDKDAKPTCPTCNGEPVSSGGEEFTCCTKDYTTSCTTDNKLKKCNGKYVVVETCKIECEIDSEANAGVCNSCRGTIKTTGGQEDDCCDPKLYVNSCSEDGAELTCVEGRVTKSDCIGGCRTYTDKTGSSLSMCIPMPEKNENEIHAIVMKDLNMADIVPFEDSIDGCAGNWKSLNLYHTHIDGNGKKIKFSNAAKSCALTRPIFDSLMYSSIKNIELSYDMRGSASSALSNHMYQSALDHVSYTGNWTGTASIFGESQTGSGVFTVYALNSSLNAVSYSGQIAAYFGKFYGLLQHASGTVITDASITPAQFNCNAQTCTPLLGYLNAGTPSNLLKDVKIDIPKIQNNITTSGAIYTASAGTIENLNSHLSDISSSSTFYGLAYSTNNITLNNIDINIDNSNFDATFYGFAYTTSNTALNNININIDNSNFKSTFFGLAGTANNTSINNINTKVDKSSFASTAYLLASSSYGSIDKADIRLSNSQSKSGLYFLSTIPSTGKASLQNIQLSVDSVMATGVFRVFSSIAGTTTTQANVSLKNCDFQINDLQSSSFQFINNIQNSSLTAEDVSIYANAHVSSPQSTSSLIHTITDTNTFDLKRLAISSRISKFSEIDSNGKAIDAQEDYTYPLLSSISAIPSETAVTLANVFWLQRNKNQTATKFTFPASSFTIDTASATVDLLNKAAGTTKWELRSVTEDGKTVKIPALKK